MARRPAGRDAGARSVGAEAPLRPAPGVGGSRADAPERATRRTGLLQQAQEILWHLVGLGEHGDAGLGEDLG
jgi:hypothetical protein